MNRIRLLLAVAVLAVSGLAACGDSSPDSSEDETADPLAVMLNWTPNAHHIGMYVAANRGWYDDAGLDLSIVEPGADGVALALAAGEVDLGISVAEGLLPARAAGIPVISVAAILPSNDSSLMALGESGIERPRDLEGARYGGYGGALETELISRLVSCDGGDPEAVEMVEIGNVDYLVGMDRGEFDLAWVFSGWDGVRATAVEGREINEIRFADYLDCIPDWYTPLFATSEETLADRPEVLERFFEVTRRGYEEAADDPTAAAADFLEQVPEADEALVTAAVAYYADMFTDGSNPWGVQNADLWTRFGDFLVDAGLLDTAVDTAAAFSNELVD